MNFGNNGNGHQQFDKAQRIAYLIAGYVRNTLSEKERDELDDWICEQDANQDTFLELIDPAFLEKAMDERNSYNSSAAIEKIREKLQFCQPVAPTVKPFRRRLATLAAAAVLLLAVLFYWLWISGSASQSQLPASSVLANLQPGASKATLTVAGRQVYVLDSISESLLRPDGVQVDKANGELIYSPANAAVQEHLLSVPRGGFYRLQLPDGSRVWLNAESSIRFPSVMNGPERVVEVTGELFFEVKKDPKRKFIVRSNKFTTEVLGTQFNLNLHDDDGSAKLYLQKGSVKVFAGQNQSDARILEPGSMLSASNNQVNISHPREEQVLAWKNGWFEFTDAPIEWIMEEVKRWYNVDVRYEGKINHHFNASIERNLPAAGLLELLEMTGQVKFEYKDGTIIVKP